MGRRGFPLLRGGMLDVSFGGSRGWVSGDEGWDTSIHLVVVFVN